MRNQLAGIKFAALNRFEQQRNRRRVNHAHPNRNIFDPQRFFMQFSTLAVHANIGNRAAHADDFLHHFAG